MDLTDLQVSHSPEFSELAPDTTVTAEAGINKNSISSSITRKQSRQQPSSPCARVRADTATYSTRVNRHTHALFPAHSLLHTYCTRCCEGNRWKIGRGEKKGKAPQNIIKAVGLGPLATGIPLTGVTCLPNKQATRMSQK